jgi:hypothetical protein
LCRALYSTDIAASGGLAARPSVNICGFGTATPT